MNHPDIARINVRDENPVLPWVLGGIAVAGVAAYQYCAPEGVLQTKKTLFREDGSTVATFDVEIRYLGCFPQDTGGDRWQLKIVSSQGKSLTKTYSTKEAAFEAIEGLPYYRFGSVALAANTFADHAFDTELFYGGEYPELEAVPAWAIGSWRAGYKYGNKYEGSAPFDSEAEALAWLEEQKVWVESQLAAEKFGNPARDENPVLPWVIGGLAVAGAAAYGAWRCAPGNRLTTTKELDVLDQKVSMEIELHYAGCYSSSEKPWKLTITVDKTTAIVQEYATKEEALNVVENGLPFTRGGSVTLANGRVFNTLILYTGMIRGSDDTMPIDKWAATFGIDAPVSLNTIQMFETEAEALAWLEIQKSVAEKSELGTKFGNPRGRSSARPAVPTSGCFETQNGGVCCYGIYANGTPWLICGGPGKPDSGSYLHDNEYTFIDNPQRSAAPTRCGWVKQPDGTYKDTCNQVISGDIGSACMYGCKLQGYSLQACREHCTATQRSKCAQGQIRCADGRCVHSVSDCDNITSAATATARAVMSRRGNPRKGVGDYLREWVGMNPRKPVRRKLSLERQTIPTRLGTQTLLRNPRFV